ncbi:tRNA 2-selenouridine(34) synthase MnmH [Alphaproteobacteria bacterium LSUCC0719]
MSPPITRATTWLDTSCDMIIDVRSEGEFAEDHIPGAVSMPVLNDRERDEIGTMYKQIGAFEAKRRGAALVARNIAAHIDTRLGDAPRDFRPLVYCWRGGQRSGAMARILSEIGWKVILLEGGYKTYRKAILDGLDSLPSTLRVIMLRGRTGTAKTRILRAAAEAGAQIIDLEGLASHRGSLLGPEPGQPQPSQRHFESHLFAAMHRLDPARPVFIEAESNKIGDLHVPRALWHRMRDAPALQVVAPLAARVKFLLADYDHIIAEPDRLKPLLSWVVTRIGHERVDDWRSCVDAGDWAGFVRRVLEDHYDPAYDRSAAARQHADLGELAVDSLDDKVIAGLARDLAAHV